MGRRLRKQLPYKKLVKSNMEKEKHDQTKDYYGRHKVKDFSRQNVSRVWIVTDKQER